MELIPSNKSKLFSNHYLMEERNNMDDVQFYIEDLKSKFLKIDFNEYYLSYSGGKDSHFLYWFIKNILHDNLIKIVSVNTYMEFPEISRRMIDNSDIVLIPSLKPHEVIEKYGSPCFSKNSDDIISRFQKGNHTKSVMMYIHGTRNHGQTMFKLNTQAKHLLLNNLLPKVSNLCCYHLKKKPLHHYETLTNKKPILGIMSCESIMRKSRYKSCFTKSMKFTPIHDCTQEMMDKIYHYYQIPLPQIYNYVSQTGCAGCPYGIGLGETEIELQLMTPQKRQYVERLFGPVYKIRQLNFNQIDIFQYIEQVY
jgi:3'-phosphoadenosine 5'-phosphosulfate sulfotransferase (PAPS reductase)/FAD synthetase